ncbi:MAG: hypothetical protein CSA33_05510 [Desulfobulbus propionicus]|nr:MAG: hypothetical protein CSA33_05510 [Desulfobulbus propionicus]
MGRAISFLVPFMWMAALSCQTGKSVSSGRIFHPARATRQGHIDGQYQWVVIGDAMNRKTG